MESELEKTQLEIAKLQLEQERRKLARMDRRQEAVGALGQGAVAAGGAAVKGGGAILRWCLKFLTVFSVLMGIAIYYAWDTPLPDLPYKVDWSWKLGWVASKLGDGAFWTCAVIAAVVATAKWYSPRAPK